jgi:hypothetical protein
MARKKSKPEIVCVCSNCGKQPPIDKEKSNENWIVYITSAPCECGGRWTHKLIETKDN